MCNLQNVQGYSQRLHSIKNQLVSKTEDSLIDHSKLNGLCREDQLNYKTTQSKTCNKVCLKINFCFKLPEKASTVLFLLITTLQAVM